MPVLLVFADNDSVSQKHIAEFFALLGGGVKEPGWLNTRLSKSRLAVVPGYSHYNFISSPEVAQIVDKFLAHPLTNPPEGAAAASQVAPPPEKTQQAEPGPDQKPDGTGSLIGPLQLHRTGGRVDGSYNIASRCSGKTAPTALTGRGFCLVVGNPRVLLCLKFGVSPYSPEDQGIHPRGCAWLAHPLRNGTPYPLSLAVTRSTWNPHSTFRSWRSIFSRHKACSTCLIAI